MSVIDYGPPNGSFRQQSNVTNIAGGNEHGNTGEMRRKYNFSEQFTELSIDQTPFFRIVSKIGKKPTDDPQFKYTEKRQSWMKRYGYVVGVGGAGAITNHGTGQLAADGADGFLYMATDYLSQGNKQNVIGQSANSIGGAGTRPEFYLPGQVVKVNMTSAAGAAMTDFRLYQVTAVTAGYIAKEADAGASAHDFKTITEYGELTDPDSAKWHEATKLTGVCVKTTSDRILTSFSENKPKDSDKSKTVEFKFDLSHIEFIG